MLRRKPTKIEVKLEDKEELQQLQSRYTTPSSTSNTATTSAAETTTTTLLQHFDRSSSKPQRIGLSSP